MNLVQVFQEVKAEFTVNENGQTTATISGTARLLGIDKGGLSKALTGKSSPLSQSLIAQGFDAVDGYGKNGIPDTALAIIAHYYAYESRAQSPEAQQLCKAFMAIGIRSWVQEQLGWSKCSQHRQQLWWDRIALFQKHTEIPQGYWTVFMELAYMWMKIEGTGFVFPEKACLDISVGKCWNKYLRSQGIPTDNFPLYPHHYPDQRGIQDAKIYPNELLAMFRNWLTATYTSLNFPGYMTKYCDKEEFLLISATVQYSLKSA